MSALVRITRRDFLRQAGVGAGALMLGCSIFPEPGLAPGAKDTVAKGSPLNAFVAIKLNGDIIIICHRSEMGQGIRSSLAAVLADELEADWARVTLRQADADAVNFGVPFPYPIPGAPALVKGEDAQFTENSQSMALYFMPMRLFGAGIRLVFLRAAAIRWGVDIAELKAEQHKILHPSTGRSSEYHELLLHATKVRLPTTDEIIAALKPRHQWRFIGGRMPFVDGKDMVTGKAIYCADIDFGRRLMLTAMIVRCPVANGALKSFNAAAALAVKGVKFVTPVLPTGYPMTGGVGANFIPHAGVAVLAENTWAALKGRQALEAEWDLGSSTAASNASYDSDSFRRELEASAAKPGKIVRSRGDVDSAFGRAAKVVEAGYYVPHLAQAPMEPPTTIALYEKGKWEIWSPTQSPELTQHYVGLAMLEPNPLKWLIWQVKDLYELREGEREAQQIFSEGLAKLLGVDMPDLFKMRDDLKMNVRDKIKVHVTLLGGGFGRKSSPDYAIEAAFLARKYPGVPIRVQWTREDDLRFSYYSAVSRQFLKAAFDADGQPLALLQRSASTSVLATLFPPPFPSAPAPVNEIFARARSAFHGGGEYPYASAVERAQGLEDIPYDLANLRIENCPAQSYIRCGCVRSGAHIFHAFGICSFADEMAFAAGRDSKEYLLELIGKGVRFNEEALRAEGLSPLGDNPFPVDPLLTALGGRVVPILPGYPLDTRRLRAVVERVAKESGWDEKKGKLPKGRGLGIAAHRSFLSYVAIVIDVSLNTANELRINEIHAALDCGLVVNPDRVRAQLEGGINYGLSISLFGEITVKNGSVVQHDFEDYRVLRINQAPKRIYTHFVQLGEEALTDYPGGELPLTGVGEPPTPVVAPALANAIFAAGGPRLREIPFCKRIVVV